MLKTTIFVPNKAGEFKMSIYVTSRNRPTTLAPPLAEWLEGLLAGASQAGDAETSTLAEAALEGSPEALRELEEIFPGEMPDA